MKRYGEKFDNLLEEEAWHDFRSGENMGKIEPARRLMNVRQAMREIELEENRDRTN